MDNNNLNDLNNLLHYTVLLALAVPFLLCIFWRQLSSNIILTINIISQIIVLSAFSYLNAMISSSSPLASLTYFKTISNNYGINYHLSFDDFNKFLILLTCFIFPLITTACFYLIKKEQKLFQVLLALSFSLVIETFLAQNLIFFYIFWESSIIPLFFMIGIWGGEKRIYATYKFVLFTSIGSLMMLAAILYLAVANFKAHGVITFEFNDLLKLAPGLPFETQKLLFVAFAFAFIIKIPVPPFHSWLPYAHVEAPAPGSMLLAAILLKLGAYGFLKFNLNLFPLGLGEMKDFLIIFFVVGAIYASLIAFVQDDIKKIVAYSSIGHMGLLMYAMIIGNQESLSGSMLSMIGHGLTSAGLFFIIGILYDRYHSRDIKELSGLSQVAPFVAVCLFIISLSSVGFPLTVGMSSEFLMYTGIFKDAFTSPNYFLITSAVLAITLVLWGTLYTFRMLRFTLWENPSSSTAAKIIPYCHRSEKVILILLVIVIIILGVFPRLVLDNLLLLIGHI